MFKLKILYKGTILVAIYLITMTSCNEGCNSQLTPNRQVKLTFAKRTGGTIFPDSTVANVFIFSIDTFYNGEAASKVSLELNLNSDSTLFFIKTDSLQSKYIDTLWFSYNTELVLLSSECGFNTSFTDFKLASYTTNKIDTVITLTEDINSDVPANFKVVMKRDTTKQ